MIKENQLHGDCFGYANMFVSSKNIPKKNWKDIKVVHGICFNRWIKKEGSEYFAHAWIEWDGFVYDWQRRFRENDPLTIDQFYDEFEPTDVVKYSPSTALLKMLKSNHHGPWEE